MYDFHKVPHLQQGVMTVDSEHELWEFSHPNFQKNQYELLHLVVRKRIRNNNDQQQQLLSQQSSPFPSPSLQYQALQQSQQLLLEQHLASTSENDLSAIPPRLNALGDTSMQLEYVRLGSLVKDISTIRHHQHAISSDLQHLHNDNEILWRETLLAREKHQRHQQVIERILLFLTTVFSNDGTPADTLRPPRYMLQKHDGNPTESQSGNLDSVAAPPQHLIEEAVRLAGISTTSLQETFIDHGIGNGGKLEDSHSPAPTTVQHTPMGQQATETLHQKQYQQHQQQQPNNQDQGQDKGKFAMKLSSSRSEQTTHDFAYHNDDQRNPQLQQNYHHQHHQHYQHHQHHQHHHHHHLMPTQQNHIPATGSSDMGMFSRNNGFGSIDQAAAALCTATSSKIGTAVASSPSQTPPGTNTLHGLRNLPVLSALSGLPNESSDSGGGGGGGGSDETGDITRIVGLAESLHTATRSAEAISQDIDDLQISIESLAATMGLDASGAEGFDGYLDEFTDNYSNMISSATKNDKMQLFELAGDSNTQDKYNDHNHTQQQQQQQQDEEEEGQLNNNDVSDRTERKFNNIPPHIAPNNV
ncbi:unnamed protein product [Absidia cylindrospora]